jgi:predicted O-methyltransferase YrrM
MGDRIRLLPTGGWAYSHDQLAGGAGQRGNMPDFDDIQRRCNGMLAPEVYQRIYEVARGAEPGSFIEVGAAHAASTVSLACALRDAGREGRVYAFEKLVGGSRDRYGDAARNRAIIEGNIAHFGLGERVQMIYGTSSECAHEVPATSATAC